jgi:hypothetical protein
MTSFRGNQGDVLLKLRRGIISMKNNMPLLLIIFSLFLTPSLGAAEPAVRKPVAEILGKAVYEEDLVPSQAAAEQKTKLSPAEYQDWHERTRQGALRDRVWSAVFSDYTEKKKIEPTSDEIDSQIRQQKKFMAEDKVRREKQREELAVELTSPGLSEARRKQAQQHLDTLNSLREHDNRLEQERKDPGRAKMWQDAQQRVSRQWVKQWKVNQALYREFGGRLIFQQAGWEPIDAYRALLDRYQANKGFVVHDRSLQDAVYGYFQHKFVYADEKKAQFYFEKPYWERTQEEMKAAGF